jgi:hypothetical protein
MWCVRQINCHSADTFFNPRNRNFRIPRADWICPNTGSTMGFLAAYSKLPVAELSFCVRVPTRLTLIPGHSP